MANSIGFAPVASLTTPSKPGILIAGNASPLRITFINEGFPKLGTSRLQAMEVKVTGDKPRSKTASLICSDCEGNGTVQCTQCKGAGVNTKDHFNGQFKAGALCWLCRGKKEILCGNCNGAGFVGGFISTGEG